MTQVTKSFVNANTFTSTKKLDCLEILTNLGQFHNNSMRSQLFQQSVFKRDEQGSRFQGFKAIMYFVSSNWVVCWHFCLFVSIFGLFSSNLVCFPLIQKSRKYFLHTDSSLNYIHRNAFEPALETRTKTVIKIITITLLMTQNTQKIINPLDFC